MGTREFPSSVLGDQLTSVLTRWSVLHNPRRRLLIPSITPIHRFLRFALVGLIGVPINLLLLALFLHLLGEAWYPLALVASFEISTTINFVLNQIYTYGEHKPTRPWDWVKRALKAQATTLSSQLVTFLGILLLKEQLGLNPYLASLIGMGGAFLYNFVVSNRFVFLPREETLAEEESIVRIKS
jgi:putative flippase GtrA